MSRKHFQVSCSVTATTNFFSRMHKPFWKQNKSFSYSYFHIGEWANSTKKCESWNLVQSYNFSLGLPLKTISDATVSYKNYSLLIIKNLYRKLRWLFCILGDRISNDFFDFQARNIFISFCRHSFTSLFFPPTNLHILPNICYPRITDIMTIFGQCYIFFE